MPVLATILTTDTFDIWRQKDNAAINAQNNVDVNSVIKIVDPLNNQDILVYNSTDGFFENTGIAFLVSSIISELATIPVDNLLPYYYANCNHQVF